MNFQPYPFEKLNELLKDITPNIQKDPIILTIGEPKQETPKFIQEELCNYADKLRFYPKTAGEEILKNAQKNFIKRRFSISLKDEEIIPTFGTREVLFNLPQFLLFDKKNPKMAFTNPFYQIYEGAAIASRAQVFYLNLTKENSFKVLPSQYKKILKEVDLVIINFPNNPTASSLNLDELCEWAKASLENDFILINDECYSEIYSQEKPPSLLEAAVKIGNYEFRNILVLNSISKRSSAPGLRSGFVAGDKIILKNYLKYRSYVGCASPLPLQFSAAKAWEEEKHVEKAREIYKNNLKLAKEILDIEVSNYTFYVWLEVEDDLEFTKKLYEKENVKVLPGSFLSRGNLKEKYVRIALVENEQKTKEALKRIKKLL